jgi:Flp pilus assembly protein TadD
MKQRSQRALFLLAAALVLTGAACGKPKAKEITSLQRKEAAALVSEAAFAVQVKDLARAEGLYAKATTICPDDAKYWVDLGALRVRMGNKSGARDAYKAALGVYEGVKGEEEPQALMQQVYVLALLGREKDARAVLATAQKKYPDKRAVRGFTDGGQFEKMIADPRFKEIAL